MQERYLKAKATRLKNNPDAYKQMGSAGGKKKRSWMTGDSESARRIQKIRWAKVKELKGLEDAQDVKEELEATRGEVD